ncbi:MAG: hypothetical protein R3C39_16280 [Dehalococcoidia bacterium]
MDSSSSSMGGGGVGDGVALSVGVGDAVAVSVGVAEAVGVDVGVLVGVAEAVGVEVGVFVGVAVGVGVFVPQAGGFGVGVGLQANAGSVSRAIAATSDAASSPIASFVLAVPNIEPPVSSLEVVPLGPFVAVRGH